MNGIIVSLASAFTLGAFGAMTKILSNNLPKATPEIESPKYRATRGELQTLSAS
jgi:hypothetical protein